MLTKRNLVAFAFLISLILIPVGCLKSVPHTPTPLPHSEWITRWLQNPVCPSPCWEGITPGVTTITDTIKTLNDMAGISTVNFHGRESNGISAHWDFNQSGGWGEVYEDEQGLVTQLDIYISPQQLLTVGEVISAYGSPSHVQTGSLHMGQCLFYIIYMDKGIILTLKLTVREHYLSLTPDTRVHELYFFPPGEGSFTRYSLSFEPITGWQGYTSYPIR